MNKDFEARVGKTTDTLRAVAKKEKIVITPDDRVGEADASHLIGYAPKSLASMRKNFESGPVWYRAPAGQAQVSYRLRDLAVWIENKREGSGI